MPAITETLSLGTLPVGLAGAALSVLAGAGVVILWTIRQRDANRNEADGRQVARPVPTEETERRELEYGSGRAEDDVVRQRLARLRDVTRDEST